jgi:hypothetical protein
MRAREPERIRGWSLPYTERAFAGTHALRRAAEWVGIGEVNPSRDWR